MSAPPVRVALAGWKGRMGGVLEPALRSADGVDLVARVEAGEDLATACRAAKAQVVVDFTTPDSAAGNARAILEAGCRGVIGTTGFSEADLQDLDRRARAKGLLLLVAPNFSLGAIVLERLAAEAARHFPRCEIVEAHHDGKKDAPSGTALATAARVGGAGSGGARAAASAASEASRGLDRSGVRVHSVRLPGLVAHQDVLFGREGEVLTLRHDVTSRTCYVEGVLRAVRWVAASARTGLVRGLEEVLFA